jgi:hypothetical protein
MEEKRNPYVVIFFTLISDLAIGAEFTFEMIKEQCLRCNSYFPETTLRKFMGILKKLETISSWKISGEKFHIYKKDYDITLAQFENALHQHAIKNYELYKKPKQEAKKVAKAIQKKVGLPQTVVVEDPNGLVGIPRHIFENMKQTIISQDAAILEYAKTETTHAQVEKQLRGKINLLTQEVAALKESITQKIDELRELQGELRRREAVAKQVPLTPADISFFERRGRGM